MDPKKIPPGMEIFQMVLKTIVQSFMLQLLKKEYRSMHSKSNNNTTTDRSARINSYGYWRVFK